MNIYVAASSQELERAAFWINLCKKADLRVTLDWVETIRQIGVANPADHATRCSSAIADEEGVKQADVVWGLLPSARHHSGRGMYYEMGIARALKKPIVTSQLIGSTSEPYPQSIFGSQHYEFLSDLEAFAFIIGNKHNLVRNCPNFIGYEPADYSKWPLREPGHTEYNF